MKLLFVLVLLLFAIYSNIAEAKKAFCDYPGCTCYFYKDPCPATYWNCSSTRRCTLPTNRPCCYQVVPTTVAPAKTFCDYPGCTCYHRRDSCPVGYYDCPSTRYCTLPSNKPCCY